mmetsp:Transcript_19688/g.61958  ORF Transcript_19688/g.61958 Transcript_19688/m.61958 type:complete len:225 (-) Transcript_19688:156-830(-)
MDTADKHLSRGAEAKITMTAAMTLIVGVAGIAFAITGRILFPYAPSTHAGDLLISCSFFTCVAACLILFSSPGKEAKAAQRAAIICVIVQIAASFTVLLITTEASFDFCSIKKPCWVGANITDNHRCDKSIRKACERDLSFLCSKSPRSASDVDRGRMNCEAKLENDCRSGSPYWGFNDRDDCLKFYTQRKKIQPRISSGLILGGGVLQFAFAILMLGALRAVF